MADNIDSKKYVDDLAEQVNSGDKDALSELIRLSEADAYSSFVLGSIYENGAPGIFPDSEKAVDVYYESAKGGNVDAIFKITDMKRTNSVANYYYNQLKKSGLDLKKLEDDAKAQIEDNTSQKDSSKSVDEYLVIRNDLNGQAKEWITKRDALNKQVRELVDEAGKHKNLRDEYNKKVKSFKLERDEYNKVVADLTVQYRELKKDQSEPIVWDPSQPSIRQLKKEFSDLENKQRTQILKKKEEEALIKRLKEIDAIIRESEKVAEQTGDLRTKSSELREAKVKAEGAHGLVAEYAKKAQSEHDQMIQFYEQADALRAQADEAQAKFIECKKKADEAHKKHLEFAHNNDK